MTDDYLTAIGDKRQFRAHVKSKGDVMGYENYLEAAIMLHIYQMDDFIFQ
jgi:hypothetical protein